MNNNKDENHYWRANIRLMCILLCVWFVVSFVFGIILVEPLNQIQLGGYKLGFWFAQQGSMYCFVVLIFFYAWRMAKLDKEHGVEEQDDKTLAASESASEQALSSPPNTGASQATQSKEGL